MRSSMGGWVERAPGTPSAWPAILKDWNAWERRASAAAASGWYSRAKARKALIMFSRPASRAPPASARNSRCRENQQTTKEPRMEKTIWNTITRRNCNQRRRCRGRRGTHRLADDKGQHPGQEQHEGIDDALDQSHGHHVAIGDVRDFVAEHPLDFAAAHAPQQAGRNGDQRPGFCRAGREGVHLLGFVNADFGQFGQAGGAGQRVNGVHQVRKAGSRVSGGMTFTPIIHLAMSRESPREMKAPPKPHTRQKTASPARPPCGK